MKTALITGGSRGLGANMAYWLAKKGVGVIVTYHTSESKVHELIDSTAGFSGKIVALKFDATNSKSFTDFIEQVKVSLKKKFATEHLDYLVNNAGHGLHKPITQTNEAELDELFQVHFKAPYLLTSQLFPILNQGGKILNISSGLARFSFPGYSAYASMKGAVEVLSRYLAKEFSEKKISVNTIAPGAIATDFNGGHVRDNATLNQNLANATALGRVGLPDDIGQSVADFLTSEANWINAQRIEISGGMMI